MKQSRIYFISRDGLIRFAFEKIVLFKCISNNIYIFTTNMHKACVTKIINL